MCSLIAMLPPHDSSCILVAQGHVKHSLLWGIWGFANNTAFASPWLGAKRQPILFHAADVAADLQTSWVCSNKAAASAWYHRLVLCWWTGNFHLQHACRLLLRAILKATVMPVADFVADLQASWLGSNKAAASAWYH